VREQVEVLEHHPDLPAEVVLVHRVDGLAVGTMSPSSMSVRRLIQRSIVDFPEPEGPTSTCTSWRSMSKEMPSRTSSSPVALVDVLDAE